MIYILFMMAIIVILYCLRVIQEMRIEIGIANAQHKHEVKMLKRLNNRHYEALCSALYRAGMAGYTSLD